MSMFSYIKNTFFSKILYFFLFPVALFPSCRQGMSMVTQPLKPVVVVTDLRAAADFANQSEQPVVIRVRVADSSDPVSPQSRERIRDLSQQQRQSLAGYIVHSVNWEKMLKKEFEQSRSGQHSEMLSMIHCDSDSYFNRMIVPYIRSSSKDEDILSLLQNNEDREIILSKANLFELVAENYIEYFPDDKNGWNFLWFYMNMEEDEAPYCEMIKKILIQRHLNRFSYGKKILNMIGNSPFRRNDGRCL